MNFKFLSGLLILCSFLFISCEADIDLSNVSNQISLHPDLVLPLGGASINLGQILANYDSLGNVSLGEKEIYFQNFDTVNFQLKNINLLQSFGASTQTLQPSPLGSIVIPPYTTVPTVYDNSDLDFGLNTNPNAERVDSVRIKSASFNVQVSVSPDLVNVKPSDIKLTLTFPNGQIRNLDGTATCISFTPAQFGQTNNIILSNFLIDMSGQKSVVPLQTAIDMKSSALPLLISPASQIIVKININQINYQVAYGYFGNVLTSSQTNNLLIDINKYLPNSLLKFTNPQVDITVNTNLGAKLRFQIDYIKAYLTTNDDFIPVYASFNGAKNTNIAFDTKPATPGLWVSKKVPTIDKDFGGTDKLFDKIEKPDMMQYQFSTSIDNTVDNTPDFITPDAGIKVYTKSTIPFQFNAGSYYAYNDTIENSFGTLADNFNKMTSSSVDSTFLVLSITNKLPVQTNFSIALLDAYGNQLPTTFKKEYTINSGKVDADGLVLPNQEMQVLTISLSNESIETIRKAKMIAYSVKVAGENLSSKIHFTVLNTFDVKVGLFVTGSLNGSISIK